MYESVRTEATIKRMIGAIADYRGIFRYQVWKEVIKIVYDNLSDEEREYLKKRLKREGIDIEEFVNDVS